MAAEICTHLGERLRPVRLIRFANDCLEVQLQSNCRERDVFIIQPLSPPVQEHLVELLLMLDAARGASAARVTAVIPHYAYARSDKKDMPRVSIGGRMVADLLVAAGANRVLTMTLHSPQVHGFFSVPVDHLHALRETGQPLPRPGPDQHRRGLAGPGQRQGGGRVRPELDLPRGGGRQAAAQRPSRSSITSIIGDVTGRDVIVLDDEIARGTTIMELLDRLRERAPGRSGWPAHTGCSCDGALKRIAARAGGDRGRLHQHGADPGELLGAASCT